MIFMTDWIKIVKSRFGIPIFVLYSGLSLKILRMTTVNYKYFP